jgi:hypothetical protein
MRQVWADEEEAEMSYAVRRYTVNSSEWTPIYPARPQTAFAFYNVDGQDMLLRSDPTDADTEWTLSGNVQEISLSSGTARPNGVPIFWAKQVVPGSSAAILKMP